MSLADNIPICARCEHFDRSASVDHACKRDGRTAVDHATRGDCPEGRFPRPTYPNAVPLTVRRTHLGIVVEEPPPATAEQVRSYLTALLTAPRVPADVTAEREATCPTCPYARWSRTADAPWCSICGCKVGGATKYLLKKLTEVEENLPAWGCHHPDRAKGSGWRR